MGSKVQCLTYSEKLKNHFSDRVTNKYALSIYGAVGSSVERAIINSVGGTSS